MDHQEPTEPSYLSLIERLASLEPRTYVFGGFAEDALLDGAVTRPHADVDVLVARATLDRHLAQLGMFGFTDFEVYFESPPGAPLVLGTTSGGLAVELGVFDGSETVSPSFVLPVDDRLVRVTLPDDTLHHPPTSIDGVNIRTVSPRALYHLREAFLRTGVFGPARDKDREAQTRLRQHLLADVPEAELILRMEPIEVP